MLGSKFVTASLPLHLMAARSYALHIHAPDNPHGRGAIIDQSVSPPTAVAWQWHGEQRSAAQHSSGPIILPGGFLLGVEQAQVDVPA